MLRDLFRFSNEFSRQLHPGQPQIPTDLRIYAIGDIHGQADLLRELAGMIEHDMKAHPVARAQAIFLGDYIDRGPSSKNVLEILSRSEFPVPIVALRGNHEAMMLAFLNRDELGNIWIRNGGLDTLYSYGVDATGMRLEPGQDDTVMRLQAAIPMSHRLFLEALPLSIAIGNYFFCHAGIRPGVPCELQREDDLLWIREEFLTSRKHHEKIIVHGHTPVPEPEVTPNRINLDTGAYISGRLTCLVLQGHSKRFMVSERTHIHALPFPPSA